MKIEPVVLTGDHVRLEPLSMEAHFAGLREVGLDPVIWKWIPIQVADEAQLKNYVASALADQAKGTALPFATIEKASGKVIGSTRYMNIDTTHRRVEIGATWIARPWQRTPINTEAKFLMMRHAFETLGCIRVELKTDSLNEQSRAAILRIGAKEEGIFRNHMVTQSGRLRHTVYFSVIDSEWPDVKAKLMENLSR